MLVVPKGMGQRPYRRFRVGVARDGETGRAQYGVATLVRSEQAGYDGFQYWGVFAECAGLGCHRSPIDGGDDGGRHLIGPAVDQWRGVGDNDGIDFVRPKQELEDLLVRGGAGLSAEVDRVAGATVPGSKGRRSGAVVRRRTPGPYSPLFSHASAASTPGPPGVADHGDSAAGRERLVGEDAGDVEFFLDGVDAHHAGLAEQRSPPRRPSLRGRRCARRRHDVPAEDLPLFTAIDRASITRPRLAMRANYLVPREVGVTGDNTWWRRPCFHQQSRSLPLTSALLPMETKLESPKSSALTPRRGWRSRGPPTGRRSRSRPRSAGPRPRRWRSSRRRRRCVQRPRNEWGRSCACRWRAPHRTARRPLEARRRPLPTSAKPAEMTTRPPTRLRPHSGDDVGDRTEPEPPRLRRSTSPGHGVVHGQHGTLATRRRGGVDGVDGPVEPAGNKVADELVADHVPGVRDAPTTAIDRGCRRRAIDRTTAWRSRS